MNSQNLSLTSKVSLSAKRIDELSIVLIGIGLLFLPVSTTLSSCITLGTVLALCLGESIKKHLGELFILPITKATIVLILFLGLRIFFNDYSYHLSTHNFIKYSHKLLTFLLLIPLFSTKSSKRQLENFLLLGALLFMVLTTLQHFHWLGIKTLTHHKIHLTISEIPWSLYLCVSAYIVMHRVLTNHSYRLLNISYWLAISVYLFTLNVERTGMLCYLFLMGFLLINANVFTKSNSLLVIAVLFSIAAITFNSPSVKLRITQSLSDINYYQAGHKHTSLGLRAVFALTSLKLIKEKPLLGHGVGNFPYVYQQSGALAMVPGQLLGDPHNTYLHLGVQIGLVGLLLYLVWLSKIFKLTQLIQVPERKLAQGLLLGFILASFSVDALLRTRICTLFTTIIACYLGQYFDRDSKEND